MLSFKEISKLIETPALIKKEDLPYLEKLSSNYPYTGIFSQLFLKGLFIHDGVRFETELKKHAYKIPDREQLHQLLHAVEEVEIESPIEVEMPAEALIETKREEQVEAVEEISEETAQEEVVQQIAEESEAVIEEGVSEEELIEEVDSVKEIQPEELDELEKEILAHAVSSSILLEVSEEGEIEFALPRATTEDKEAYAAQKEEQVEVYAEEEIEEVEADDETKTKTKTIEEEVGLDESSEWIEEGEDAKLSFSSWLTKLSSSSDLEEKKQVLSEEKTVKKEVEQPKEEKKQEKIIVEKRKSEFFSPAKKARESLDESRLPVSETLAKIYAAQGNYPKAIESYQKLMLIIPEKKTYFALQIESLKRKLN